MMEKQIMELNKKYARKRTLKRIVALLCVFVMLFTVNSLKMVAQTLTRKPMCGLKNHLHQADCYDSNGNLICGMVEHQHTDACYQESPTLEIEDEGALDLPVDELQVNDGLSLELDAGALDLNGDLVVEDVATPAQNNAVETPTYTLGSKALLSNIIKSTDLKIKLSEIREVGIVDNDGSQVGLIEINKKDNGDYRIKALRDFDTVELAVVLADEVVVVKLVDGVAPVEEPAAPVVAEQPVQAEQPAVEVEAQPEQAQPAVVEQPEQPEAPDVEIEQNEQPGQTTVVDEQADLAVENIQVEAPAVEDTQAEETVTEEPAAEQAEAPVVEDTKAEAPVVDEQAEAPAVEDTQVEETVTEEPAAEQAEETVDTQTEESAQAEEPEQAEEPVVEDTQAEAPVVEDTQVEEPEQVEAPTQAEEPAVVEEESGIEQIDVLTDEETVSEQIETEQIEAEQGEEVAPADEEVVEAEQGEEAAPADEEAAEAEQGEEVAPADGEVVEAEQGEEVAPADEEAAEAEQGEEVAPADEEAVEAEQGEEVAPADEEAVEAEQGEEAAPADEEVVEAEQGEEAAPADEEAVEAEQGEEAAPAGEEAVEAEQGEEVAPTDEVVAEAEQGEEAAPADEEVVEAEQGEAVAVGEPEDAEALAVVDTEAEDEVHADEQGDDTVYSAGSRAIEVNDSVVTLTWPAEAKIPEDVVITISEIEKGTPDYDTLYHQALAELPEPEQAVTQVMRFFDITLYTADGKKIEPAAPVSVVVSVNETVESDVAALHCEEVGAPMETVEANAEGESVAFDAPSFSVYGVNYQVPAEQENVSSQVQVDLSRVDTMNAATVEGMGVSISIPELLAGTDEAVESSVGGEIDAAQFVAEATVSSPDVAVENGTITLPADALDKATVSLQLETKDTDSNYITTVTTHTVDIVLSDYAGRTGETVGEGVTVKAVGENSLPADAKASVEENVEVPQSVEVKEGEAAAAFDINLTNANGDAITGPVAVTVMPSELNVLSEVPEGAVAKNVVYTLLHVHDDGTVENVELPADAVVVGEDGKVESFSFETESFSTYVLKYTVDFEYNGYQFSMPGGGVMRLSDVLTALNIPCEVSSLTKVVSSNTDVLVVTHAETDASEFEMYMAAHGLTEVMEAINAGLYADETEDETAGEFKDRIVSAGDWIVFSIAPFDTQETLTLVADNGTTYVVGFTDPASDGEFDITSMLTDVTLVIDGRDVTGNTWQVEEGQTYNLKLKFAETDFSQFPNSGTMYYQLPSGIYTENYSRTFDVKIRMNGKTYMLPGNTFTVNTDGEVRIQWNTEHPMYRYLLYSGNTSVTLNLTGMFLKNTTRVIFSDTVTKTIEVKEIHDVSVTKQSTYNAATGKIHYVVQVTSAGENRPVSVHDILGTALKIDGNVTITSNKGNVPNYTGGVKADNTGFDYTFGDASSGGLRDGEIITIEYDAVIDYDKIGKSGNATFNETKNVVNAEYPNDDNPGDNEASTYESNISFSTFGKDAVTMGNVYTEKEGDVDVMYRDITWKITANEDHSVSMEGSTFKDVNNSSNIMKYKGEGITVVITAPGNQATTTETISYDSMAYHSDQGWSWTVPDEAPFKGKQKYEITYTTKVRIGDGSQTISVQNYAEGKGGSDSEQVPVWTGTGTVTPGPTGSSEPGPTPPPEIVANKAVTKSTVDFVDWKITVMIPAEGYNDDFFVVDTLPSVYFNSQYVYDTYDSTTGVNVNGLVDGETYNVTDEGATVKIQFYDNDQDSPKGLKGTGASRVLTISLRTLVNQDWYDYAEEHGSYYWQHKNKATITANGATKETSAEAAPKRKSIKKVVQSTNNTFTDDNDITHRAFLYQIVLSSVDRDQIVINEVFDSSLKICPVAGNPGYQNLRVMGGNSYGPMSAQEFAEPTFATVQETATGARLIIDVPKKSGTFADYYYIEYFLYVANEELAVAKAQSNDGVALLGNTATWDGIPGHADVEYSYEGVGKSATQVYETDEHGQQVPTDRFNYTIVLNPDKVRLNDGNNMIMTDTFTNLAIDYSSIKITFDPAQTDDYPFDYSGNVGTFTIPDETKVTITYQARIIGGQEGETITATNTAEMYGFMDSSTVSHTFSADAEGEGRVPSIRVLKYGENNMGQPFEGAVFQLYDANKQVITYPDGATNGKAGQPVKFTTVSTDQTDLNGEVILNKGYALVTLVEHGDNADGMTLQFDTVYYLREVKAPTINGVEYAVDSTYYQFQISRNDTADYDRYIYMDGDILKIRNYPKRYELKLVKKLNLPQDATMDDSQRANIRFEIKSVDTNGNPNGAYRKVVYFNNFDYDSGSQSYIYSLQDVPAGTYRVTEYGDDVYDYHLTAANVEYVTDGDDGTPAPSVVTPVGEESTPTIQFTMSQENELAEVKYTNNYEVRHTYYFTKVEQGNTSIRVPGTTFIVYNAGDNTQVGEPYLTDENGKFSIYMDDGHNYQSDTLYYVMEKHANPDYVLPDDPPKYYFYFGGTVTVPNGITPVNLGAASARQTVENEIKTVDIPVEKTWVDVVNMPASVTVKLLRRLVDSGDPWEETDKILVLTPDENDDTKDWKGSFENLDKDYEYKVEEVIPEGVYYAATYANNDGVKEQSDDKTIEIINTTTLKNITVHKIWVDEPADDPNYQRPTAYFTLQVKKPDEGEWVNADNNGFAALYDSGWNNTEFNAIVKDKINLYGSITSENASCEWTNLPGRFIYRVVETDSNHIAFTEGQKIDEGKYIVTYDNAYTDGVSQGDVLITNTYNFTSLKVKKLWNTADVAPNSVYVSLYRNALFGETATYPASNPVWIGVPYSSNNNNIRQIELKKSENFQGEFTNLEKGYVYHLVETPVAGYTTTISDGNIYYGGETVTITNTKYTTDDKAIQVKKLWYDTEGNPMTDNLPDHVDVELKRISGHYDGHNVKVTLNHSGSYDIGSCQVKIANNSSVSFTISAGDSGRWDSNIQYFDGTITGSYKVISGSANVSVNIGDQNASHNIPITITVENPTADCDIKVILTPSGGSWLNGPVSVVNGYTPATFVADGDDQSFEYNPSTTQSLNSGNNWAYKWTNLPADDGNGTAYLYTIEEKAVVDGQGNSHIQDYQLTIDDGNHGEGVPTGVIFLKNTKIPNGSLKLMKHVIKNGTNDTTNGYTYFFKLYQLNDQGQPTQDPQYYIRLWVTGNQVDDYRVYTNDAYNTAVQNDNLTPKQTDDTTVDGVYFNHGSHYDGYAVIHNLPEGDYLLTEVPTSEPSTAIIVRGDGATDGVVDAANRSVKLHVTAGVDNPDTDTAAVATFTNSYDITQVTVHKVWVDDQGDLTGTPTCNDTGADAKFELQRKVGDNWVKATTYANGTSIASGDNPKTIHVGDNNWTYTWNNLPKYDGQNLIEYRVVENGFYYGTNSQADYDVTESNGVYTVTKRDAGVTQEWVVTMEETSQTNTFTYTNTKTGALKLKKLVTVDSAATTTTLADGDYTFTIHRSEDGETTTDDKTVVITITNGVAASATVGGNSVDLTDGYVVIGDLIPGDYVITENEVSGMTVSSITDGKDGTANTTNRSVTVTVEPGQTTPADQASATFTNDKVTKGSLEISKALLTGSEAFGANQEFKFIVWLGKLTHNDEHGNSVDWTGFDQQKVLVNDVETEVGTSDSNKYVRVTITGAGTATISNLPAGTIYLVVEETTEGWKLSSVVDDDTQTFHDTDSEDNAGSSTDGKGIIAASAIDHVTVTNYKLGALKLKKLVKVDGNELTLDNSDPVRGRTYHFTVVGPAGDASITRYVLAEARGGTDEVANVFKYYASTTDHGYSAVDWYSAVDPNKTTGDGSELTLGNLEPGQYTITEDWNNDIDDDMITTVSDETTSSRARTITVNVTASATPSVEVTYTNDYVVGNLSLRKVATASTMNPINGDNAKAAGTYKFTFVGPVNESNQPVAGAITKYVRIYASYDSTRKKLVYRYEMKDEDAGWNDSNAQSLETDAAVIFDHLKTGNYLITETGWTLDSTTSGAEMHLDSISVSPNDNGQLVAMNTDDKTLKVHVDGVDETEIKAVFTNELVPNTMTHRKMVLDVNDSSDTDPFNSSTEQTWEDSADYDIGDHIPYRVTGFLPQADYRASKSYYYRIDDVMQNLEYVDGTGHMFAFVKGPTDVEGHWYQVDEYFTIDAPSTMDAAGAITDDGNDTIKYLRAETNKTDGLKAIKQGYLTTWGEADTHKNDQKAEPTVANSTTSIDPDNIQYLQFRYKAELLSTANIGATGNANDAKVYYGNSDDPHSTGWDRNRVFTYKVLINKTYEKDDATRTESATFALYKKYITHSDVANSVGIGNSSDTTLYAEDRDKLPTVTAPATKVYPNDKMENPGNYYFVGETDVDPSDNTFEWVGLDDGYYILVELSAPEGYIQMSVPIQFAIVAAHDQEADDPALHLDGGTYVNVWPESMKSSFLSDTVTTVFNRGTITGNITNKPYLIDIRIEKVIADSSTPLDGAVFKLSKYLGKNGETENWQAVSGVKTSNTDKQGDPVVTGSDGQFTINGNITLKELKDGRYKLEEVSAPEGYIITNKTPVTFTILHGAVVSDSNVLTTGVTYTAKRDAVEAQGDKPAQEATPDTFTIPNTPGASLPATGGSGTTLYYIAGASLLLLALALLLRRKRNYD